MPAKKTAKKTAKKKANKPKAKSIFDHVKHVKTVQDPKYLEKLSDGDRKSWSNWMALKILSMNEDYLSITNLLQQFVNMKSELMYSILINVIPKQNTFDKFISASRDNKYEPWLVDLIRTDMMISFNEAIDYLDIFMLTEEGKCEILSICQKYSIDEKEIKKLKL
jgi:hypothetical protein